MDLTKLSDADLLALKAGDYSKMSDDGLKALKASSAPKPSGAVAGLKQGLADLVNSHEETAKDFLGAGNGPSVKTDPNYVPANITNGSYNPLNWNYSQLPQKAAELAPGLGENIIGATAGAKVGKMVAGAPGAAVGGALGAFVPAWLSSAGNAAKKDAVDRTGDPNATPNAADLTRAGLTSAASSAVQTALPTRFIPGANKITAVGGEGALQAVKKYLATTALGGATNAAGNAIDQVGNTIGTDKGTQFDPKQALDAGLGGAAVAGALAAPRGVADVGSAASLANFGGANAPATAAYANRLQTAGDGKLGKELGGAAIDYTAHKTAVADIQNELRDAAKSVRGQTTLGPDADNALQRAQDGHPITPSDLSLIENSTAGAPDGANASFLARQMHVAQQAEKLGSFDATHKEWAGGTSGVLDKNLGFLLNPTRLVAGTMATGLGMHLLGASNPMFAGGLAGAYGVARGVDKLAGMRSPAKAFADRFADAAQANRLPTAQPPAPPAPPSTPPSGPWGPRPLPQQSVPQVAPTAPPPAAPQFSPIALSMLKQTLKTNAAAQPQAPQPQATPAPAASAPAAPPPGTAPWKAPQVTELPQFSNVAMKMLGQKLKEGLPAEPAAPTPEQPEAPQFNPLALSMLKQKLKASAAQQDADYKANVAQAFSENKTVNSDFGANQAQAVSENKARDAEAAAEAKAASDAEKAHAKLQAAALKSSTKAAAPSTNGIAQPKTMADVLNSVNAITTPTKITKTSGGKVQMDAPQAPQAAPAAAPSDPWNDVGAYTPPVENPHVGKSVPQIVQDEMQRYKDLPPQAQLSLRNSIHGTRTARDVEIKGLQEQFPGDHAVLQALRDALHAPGNSNQDASRRAIKHFTGLMSGEASKATRARFDSKGVQDAIWPKRKHTKKNSGKSEAAPQEAAAE